MSTPTPPRSDAPLYITLIWSENYIRRSIRDCSHLEYGNPCESDVVERDGTAVRIAESGLTDGVVLVPVDARRGRDGRRRGISGASARM